MSASNAKPEMMVVEKTPEAVYLVRGQTLPDTFTSNLRVGVFPLPLEIDWLLFAKQRELLARAADACAARGDTESAETLTGLENLLLDITESAELDGHPVVWYEDVKRDTPPVPAAQPVVPPKVTWTGSVIGGRYPGAYRLRPERLTVGVTYNDDGTLSVRVDDLDHMDMWMELCLVPETNTSE